MTQFKPLAAALLLALAPASAPAFQAPAGLPDPAAGLQDPATGAVRTQVPGAAGAVRNQAPGAAGAQVPAGTVRTAPGQVTAQPAPAGAQAQPMFDDRLFAVVAAESGMAEIAVSQLAAERASSEEVKRMAQQMIQDHSQANQQLMSAAQTVQAPMPRGLSPSKQADLAILATKQGAEFDKAYIDQQLAAHICSVALFRAEAEQGRNPELKQLAAQTLPKLEQHLQMVRRMASGAQGADHAVPAGGAGAQPPAPAGAAPAPRTQP
jgi:putative membrane protein